MAKVKSIKAPIGFHTSNQKMVSGDYNGTAIKQKIGRVRDIYPVDYSPITKKGSGKPPKSLA